MVEMSLFIVCFDLKNAESVEYEIWKNAFEVIYEHKCKRIERTTWLLCTDGGALDVYKSVLEHVKSGMVANKIKDFRKLDEDLFEILNDYATMEINELEPLWMIKESEIKKIECDTDKYLKNMKVFVGEITKSEDNVAGCLNKQDWGYQAVSPEFIGYFKNKNGECKIRLI